MYGKLFESTFTGSMCGKGAVTFAVWCYAIAHTHTDSLVEINPLIVAAILGCEVAEVEEALRVLCSEDPYSRTETEGGRRLIEEGRYLYRSVNWGKYNGLANNTARREYNRLAQQKFRAKRAEKAARQPVSNIDVSNPSAPVTGCHPLYAESESESEKKGESPPYDPNANGKKPPRKPNASRKHPIPDDFTADADLTAYVAKHLPGVDVPAFVESFACKARAKGWQYVNWRQAFQDFVRSAAPNSGHWSAGQYPKQHGVGTWQ